MAAVPAPVPVGAPVHAALIAHLRAALPLEGCGFLVADAGGDLGWWPARNADASPLRYTIHPEDLVATYVRAEATGGRVVAAVHSHPRGPSGPSATDRSEWADPDLVMGIVSFADDPPRLRLYRQRGPALDEEPAFDELPVDLDEEGACVP